MAVSLSSTYGVPVRYFILLAYGLACFAVTSGALAATGSGVECATVQTPHELDSLLVSNQKDSKPTLVYVRADWALSGLFNNDTYVPSIAFLKLISGTNCIVADMTNNGGQLLIKRFQSGGLPFFVLLDSSNKLVSVLKNGKDYSEFEKWFDMVYLIRLRPVSH